MRVSPGGKEIKRLERGYVLEEVDSTIFRDRQWVAFFMDGYLTPQPSARNLFRPRQASASFHSTNSVPPAGAAAGAGEAMANGPRLPASAAGSGVGATTAPPGKTLVWTVVSDKKSKGPKLVRCEQPPPGSGSQSAGASLDDGRNSGAVGVGRGGAGKETGRAGANQVQRKPPMRRQRTIRTQQLMLALEQGNITAQEFEIIQRTKLRAIAEENPHLGSGAHGAHGREGAGALSGTRGKTLATFCAGADYLHSLRLAGLVRPTAVEPVDICQLTFAFSLAAMHWALEPDQILCCASTIGRQAQENGGTVLRGKLAHGAEHQTADATTQSDDAFRAGQNLARTQRALLSSAAFDLGRELCSAVVRLVCIRANTLYSLPAFISVVNGVFACTHLLCVVFLQDDGHAAGIARLRAAAVRRHFRFRASDSARPTTMSLEVLPPAMESPWSRSLSKSPRKSLAPSRNPSAGSPMASLYSRKQPSLRRASSTSEVTSRERSLTGRYEALFLKLWLLGVKGGFQPLPCCPQWQAWHFSHFKGTKRATVEQPRSCGGAKKAGRCFCLWVNCGTKTCSSLLQREAGHPAPDSCC